MSENILNIKKLKIECKSCGTIVITDIGKTVYQCPTCSQDFEVKRDNSYYTHLKTSIEMLKAVNGANFSLICEDEQ